MKKNNELDFSKIEKRQQLAKILSGLFVILFGVCVLLHQLDVEIPKIFRSWELILIMIGLVILVKHNFKNFGGYALILIGSVLMLNDFYPDLISMRIIWPSIIILFGVSIILKAFTSKKSNFLKVNNPTGTNSDSFIETAIYFGSVLKKVDTQNFKGAVVTAVFGGVEIDLTDCEVEDLAVIDIMSVFSGVTLVIPSEWEVKSELSSVLGGIEDKRAKNTSPEMNKKRVLLRGTCVFSGVDISNFAKRR